MLEGGILLIVDFSLTMDLLSLMKHRRSIRRYTDRPVDRADLDKILEAGVFAPNAGGGQRSMIVALRRPQLVEQVGRLNVACMDRSRLAGSYVSKEQPSIIDDPTIRSGFYGAPAVAIVFAQRNFLYSIPDAFCCAENMVLMATELGISSCIIARGEKTFDNAEGQRLLEAWGIPDHFIARCFVTLGYHAGDYPQEKPRRAGRTLVIE
jgi:nitroreductase